MVFRQILKSADHHPARMTIADKNVAKRLDFKDIKFPVKTRDIHKVEKKNSIGISIFGYENEEVSNLCIKKMLRR